MSRPAGSPGDPEVVTAGLLRSWELPRSQGDKEDKGRVLVVGGHVQVPGATLLAAEAAMRAGAGKLQVATAEPLAVPLGIALPEARSVGLPIDDGGALSGDAADIVVELANESTAVVLGPGFMDPGRAAAFCAAVVPKLEVALCLDALGLALLTENLGAVQHLAGKVVLSPNAVELATTLGRDPDDVADADLPDLAAELAAATGAVVLSGAATSYVVAPGGQCWSDDSGGPGMGVSGSGDVKAGIIGGLLARGCEPEQAAVWAGWVHGRSGERLAAAMGGRGFLARDLLPEIPVALSELEG